MSLKENNKKSKAVQEQIEERVKYFMKYQPQNNIKQKNLKRSPKSDNYSTLIDPINNQSNNLSNLTQNIFNNFNRTQNINNNNSNNNVIYNKIETPITNKNKNYLNDSTLSTQTLNNLDLPMKKSTSFHVSKELVKYTEPRNNKKEFFKLKPKFSLFNSINDSINIDNDVNTHILSKHKYTNSELELLETDEKVPQNKIKEITNNILENNNNNYSLELANNSNILLIFHFLTNIEKCYQELSNDLNGNGLKNIGYKLKIACNYLNEITDEKNIISDMFLNNEDDINIFLIRELCLYLFVLFLDIFQKEFNNNNINEFLTCHNYCHINLLYVIMICIKKIEQYLSENKIKFGENSAEYYDFQKCKILIELKKDKININKYKDNFHTNNKIIKNIFIKILNNIDEKDNDIIKIIMEIFNLSKKSKFKTIINEHLKNNSLIKDKIENVEKKYHSPENSNENEISQLNGGIMTQKIKPPYLPPKREDDNRDYCLVLDLDETLVHFFEENNEAYVKVRMGAENFITVLSQFCEIVIFTASTKNYADIVIDGLDCKNLIDYKLYREHTDDYNGINIKDLSKLGRDLNKVIIIDNIEDNYILQPNNGLNIIDFEGDENDNELEYILKDLLEIVKVPGKIIINELPQIRKNMQKRYCNI